MCQGHDTSYQQKASRLRCLTLVISGISLAGYRRVRDRMGEATRKEPSQCARSLRGVFQIHPAQCVHRTVLLFIIGNLYVEHLYDEFGIHALLAEPSFDPHAAPTSRALGAHEELSEAGIIEVPEICEPLECLRDESVRETVLMQACCELTARALSMAEETQCAVHGGRRLDVIQ